MGINDRVYSGSKGFDQMIESLRLGDYVFWQIDSVSDYRIMVEPYVTQAKLDERNLIYVRFGNHEPLLQESPHAKIYEVNARKGFESFAIAIREMIEQEGKNAFYVFDCLTDLLQYWNSDLMIGNFFKVNCPFLFVFDTIAYFALIRNVHTNSTNARIREMTQLLLDLYQVNSKYYIHPP